MKRLIALILCSVILFSLLVGCAGGSGRTENCSHTYEIEKIVSSTCESQGYTLCKCSRCSDEKRIEYTPKKGHSYTIERTPGTCTKMSFNTHTCTNCGDSYNDDYDAAYGDHVGIEFCSVCGADFYYEFVEMLMQNGTKYMDLYMLSIHLEDSTISCSYSTTEEAILVSCDDFSMLIDDASGSYIYSLSYGDYKMMGYVQASLVTDYTTRLNYFTSSYPSYLQDLACELAMEDLKIVLIWMDIFFNTYEAKMSCDHFGFVNYDY